jgi:diphthamide synthase (EF-2-diphthine--ammonia ligase)
MAPIDVVLSWSGGKDSIMALRALRQNPSHRVTYLLTTVNSDYDRISIHGVRRSLLRQQAAVLEIDLIEVTIPTQCSHRVYEAKMVAALTSPRLASIQTHAFADLFLEDVRTYREDNLSKLGKKPMFPVWGRDTHALAREFIRARVPSSGCVRGHENPQRRLCGTGIRSCFPSRSPERG